MEDTLRIADALTKDNLQDSTPFFVEDELINTDINVEIGGLGLLTFPLTRDCIPKLITNASTAQFSLSKQEISNANIYEFPPDKLRVTINEHSLTCMLNKMRDKLLFGESTVLIPHLCRMLIYGPGQISVMPQDGEELENIVATLVIVLPAPHIGGNLLIKHGNKCHAFSTQNIYASDAKCIAFYSDCQYKIETVLEGHHVALTYNLILKSKDCYDTVSVIPELRSAIADYFSGPKKLVYFLNHTYTEHSLKWNLLKGVDRANASAIYMVAEELGLVLHLTLVEIKEAWSCDAQEVKVFLYGENTLSYWLDRNNQIVTFKKCKVEDREICLTKRTKSFDSYQSKCDKYENSYWYRRGAIVLWSSEIVINFSLSYDSAIKELNALAKKPGNEERVSELAVEAGIYLYKDSNEFINEKNFIMAANIALYIKDRNKALSILSIFDSKMLKFNIIQILMKLKTQYSVDWCIELLNYWNNAIHDINFYKYSYFYSAYILDNFNNFISDFLNSGFNAEVVEQLLDIQSKHLMNYDKKIICVGEYHHQYIVSAGMKKLEDFFLACATIQNVKVADKVIEHVISVDELYPAVDLIELFSNLRKLVYSEYCKVVEAYPFKIIDSRIASLMNAEYDWSIHCVLRCRCEYCAIITNFFHSKSERSVTWFIKEAICKHVVITFRKSPTSSIRLSVERLDTKNKLVMVKKKALYKYSRKQLRELKKLRKRIVNRQEKL